MLAIVTPEISLSIVFVGIIVFVVPVWFLWRTFERAGFPPTIALICIVPGGLYVALGILAFAKWPNRH
jgi:hypothetical protein